MSFWAELITEAVGAASTAQLIQLCRPASAELLQMQDVVVQVYREL
jgi:hypothetical protein